MTCFTNYWLLTTGNINCIVKLEEKNNGDLLSHKSRKEAVIESKNEHLEKRSS